MNNYETIKYSCGCSATGIAPIPKDCPEGHGLTRFLEEAETRANAATPGPWESGLSKNGENAPLECCVTGFRDNTETIIARADGDTAEDSADMDFIAQARADVMSLIALVRKLRNDTVR